MFVKSSYFFIWHEVLVRLFLDFAHVMTLGIWRISLLPWLFVKSNDVDIGQTRKGHAWENFAAILFTVSARTPLQ